MQRQIGFLIKKYFINSFSFIVLYSMWIQAPLVDSRFLSLKGEQGVLLLSIQLRHLTKYFICLKTILTHLYKL